MRNKLFSTGFTLFTLLTLLFVTTSTVHSTETIIPSFGEGKVKVRLYTDYFCPPCKEMEPGIEPVISELIKNKVINLTFADTPFYKYSSLYVRYFLYAINEKRDLEHALYVRRSLIEASNIRVEGADKMENFLKGKGIKLKPLDPKPVFTALTGYLKEDLIDATPTCVIEVDGKKCKHVGADDIISALNKLKKK